jgi:hypothetical protein
MDKKITNGQLQRKIKNALVFVPKDKNYQVIFFDDKMIRLECTDDFCVISTGYHRHVFDAVNYNQGVGFSRPYLYTKKIIEIAFSNDCQKENGVFTYEHMLDVLSTKEDKSDYNIATYYQWWLFNIFQPLYSIGENEIETFLVYEQYLHNIARSKIILSEKTEDITNRMFIDEVLETERKFTDGMNELVVFHKITDEEMKNKEFEAIQEESIERTILDGNTDKKD